MASVKLVAKNKATKKDGTTPIYLQYCYDSEKRTLINTGYCIEPKYWNYKKDLVRGTYQNFETLSDELDEELNRLKDIIREAKKENIDPTIDFIKNRFNNRFKNSVPVVKLSLFEALDKFIEDSKGRVVKGN